MDSFDTLSARFVLDTSNLIAEGQNSNDLPVIKLGDCIVVDGVTYITEPTKSPGCSAHCPLRTTCDVKPFRCLNGGGLFVTHKFVKVQDGFV